MPKDSECFIAHEHSTDTVKSLVSRIDAGEQVTDTERLKVINDVLAFSGRDWGTDPELWAIYEAASHEKETSDDE